MLKKVVSSLLFGSSLGTAPFVVATSLPSSIKEEKEESFGETCLLGLEICQFMSDIKFEKDVDVGAVLGEDTSGVKHDVWKKYLESMKMKKTYCGWGFAVKRFNTIQECKKDLKEQVKK